MGTKETKGGPPVPSVDSVLIAGKTPEGKLWQKYPNAQMPVFGHML
jgi:hypothetical protein